MSSAASQPILNQQPSSFLHYHHPHYQQQMMMSSEMGFFHSSFPSVAAPPPPPPPPLPPASSLLTCNNSQALLRCNNSSDNSIGETLMSTVRQRDGDLLLPSLLLPSHVGVVPHLLSLQRSAPNLWAWGELLSGGDTGFTTSKRSADCSGDERLGVSTVKMKKVKGRRKVREPRFCFKTLSDVDVLDDGYKWRKYGQKVVKNTHHPRSYYRCTQDNCRVKKRVERLAEDPRMVITTYEGRHVHYPSQDQEESQAPSNSDGFFW